MGTAYTDYRAEFENQATLKGANGELTLTFSGSEDRTNRKFDEDIMKPTRGGGGIFYLPYPRGVHFTYRAGAQYLLFLVQFTERRAWIFPKIPLSRLNAKVDGEDATSVQAVKHYLRIARLRDERVEAQALCDPQAKARGGENPLHYPFALVADVERYFRNKAPSGS